VQLEGKIVLVTGGSSGIGRAIAIAAARAGADVAITYRGNAEGAAATAREITAIGRGCHVARTDVSRQADVGDLAAAMREKFGRVDAWINNAGADILTGKGAKLTPLEKLDLLLAVDLRGTVLASWAAVELMRERGGGVIINMSWDHVSHGLKGENPILYSAAKGGVMSFSKSLAREVAPAIRVNILAPGFIDTAFGQAEATTTWRREVESRTPLGRWGTPDDVAKAAVFLASDDAAFLTGQMLMVNGGVVM
jgi:3-oxoacyl-[acyl-carrier protein] reductase